MNKRLDILIEKLEKISKKKVILLEFTPEKILRDPKLIEYQHDLQDMLDEIEESYYSYKLPEYGKKSKIVKTEKENDIIRVLFENNYVVEYNVSKDNYSLYYEKGSKVECDITESMSKGLVGIIVELAKLARKAYGLSSTKYNYDNVGEQGEESYLESVKKM